MAEAEKNDRMASRRALLQQSLIGGMALAGAGLAGFSPDAEAQSAGQPAANAGTARRVVTGNNARGKSYIVKDEVIKHGFVWSNSPEEMLGPNGAGDPKTLLPTSMPSLDPPVGGARWQFYPIQPSKKKKGESVDRTLGNGTVGKDGFHRTATIDYVLVTNGELTVFLDEGETALHAGDLVIQRNTSHAWQNYGSAPVTLLAMMIRV